LHIHFDAGIFGKKEKAVEKKISVKPGSVMKCPKCDVKMKITMAGEIELDECPKCRGLWVDLAEEKTALKMEPATFTVDELRRLRKVYRPLGRVEKVKYHRCPRCGKFMWRKNYMYHSGIVVDKCREHGTFFDKGELEKAIEFVKKGGAEYEKLKITEEGLSKVQARLTRTIDRVETDAIRRHWVGRFLSVLGF
jgi:Zn-finger nucleic acid-binding protein